MENSAVLDDRAAVEAPRGPGKGRLPVDLVTGRLAHKVGSELVLEAAGRAE